MPTKYQFTGQFNQIELGIYYYNARWYDGTLGRFTQADTIIPLTSQGVQAWDRYAYGSNNPLRYTDPSGHSADCAIGEFGCQAGRLSRAGIGKLYDDYHDLNFLKYDPHTWEQEQWIIWNNMLKEMTAADIPEGHFEWKPDWVSVAIDIGGILGDLGLASGTPPEVLLDAVATWFEIQGFTRDLDDLDIGNPIGFTTDITTTIGDELLDELLKHAPKGFRIAPGLGSIASVIDIVKSLLPTYVSDK